ncbi:hypothetical protein [Streptomyces sp. NPDC005438]
MSTAVEPVEVVEQDVELTDLASLADDLFDEQVERPGVACEIAT